MEAENLRFKGLIKIIFHRHYHCCIMQNTWNIGYIIKFYSIRSQTCNIKSFRRICCTPCKADATAYAYLHSRKKKEILLLTLNVLGLAGIPRKECFHVKFCLTFLAPIQILYRFLGHLSFSKKHSSM